MSGSDTPDKVYFNLHELISELTPGETFDGNKPHADLISVELVQDGDCPVDRIVYTAETDALIYVGLFGNGRVSDRIAIHTPVAARRVAAALVRFAEAEERSEREREERAERRKV
jgi:hypothetical protein